MTKDEALKMALAVLKSKDTWGSSIRGAKEAAILAGEAALAQPEQKHPLQVKVDRDHAWKVRDTDCGCDHNEYCEKCWPLEFRKGGYWDQQEALAQPEQEPKCGAIIEVFGKDWRLEYLSLPVGKHKLYTQQYTYTVELRDVANLYAKYDALYKARWAAQSEQEPVAWRTFDGEGGYEYRTYDMNEQYAEGWEQRNPKHKDWVEPLFTSPPQRQPLTLAEIDALDFKAINGGSDSQYSVRFARAVEAAHGIGDKT